MEFKRKKKVKPEEKPKAKSEEPPKKQSILTKEKWYGVDNFKEDLGELSEEDYFEAGCHQARAMQKRFGRMAWMSDFIDQDGNNLPFKKGIMP